MSHAHTNIDIPMHVPVGEWITVCVGVCTMHVKLEIVVGFFFLSYLYLFIYLRGSLADLEAD